MTRVVHARLPEEIRPACEALSRQVRDLHHTSICLVRVALGCLDWDSGARRSVLKAEKDLPKDGRAVLAVFNVAIVALNAKRTKDTRRGQASAAARRCQREAGPPTPGCPHGVILASLRQHLAPKWQGLAFFDSFLSLMY